MSTRRRDGWQLGRDGAVGRIAAVAVLAAVGAALAAYSLPPPLRRSLAFEYGDPTLLTAYTAHFVHLTASHLLRNLAAFLLACGTIYWLSRRAGRPWLFVGPLAVLLSVYPFVLSYLNLAVPRNGMTYGLSGLTMALAGFVPIASIAYLGAERDRGVDSDLPLASFFVSVGYVAAVSVPRSERSVAIAVAALAAGTVFAVRFGRRSSALLPEAADPTFLAGVGVWLALLSVGFPDASADGAVVNVYVHFLGYALGYTTAYLAYEWRLFERDAPTGERTSPNASVNAKPNGPAGSAVPAGQQRGREQGHDGDRRAEPG